MTSQDFRPQDREALSALFDGELDPEARRFALRRLGHDADWQRDCGRWQLIGDALRRQAPIAAPDGFATRVAAAIASEQSVVAAAAPQASTGGGSRARWIGGALAASVALVAAVSALRPGAEPAAASPVMVAASPAGSAPAAVAVATPPSAPVDPAPARPTQAGGPASGMEPARRLARVDRAAPSRPAAARRGIRSEPVPAAATMASSAETRVAASFLPEAAANPFNLGTDAPLTARPWPRATLPAAGAAFTARYGAAAESAGERPSFYPFEPRLPATAEPVPSP